MARVGGRSTWFAWFVGLTCTGVVVALAWLAVPALPAAAEWVGELLRGPAETAEPTPADPIADDPASSSSPATLPADCRSLYPDGLWGLLSETPGAVLTEGADASVLLEPQLIAATNAEVVVVCRWDAGADAVILTALARVDELAPAAVAGQLAATGFACSDVSGGIRCERQIEDVAEVHEVRDGRWLATRRQGWHPPDYDLLVAQRLGSD